MHTPMKYSENPGILTKKVIEKWNLSLLFCFLKFSKCDTLFKIIYQGKVIMAHIKINASFLWKFQEWFPAARLKNTILHLYRKEKKNKLDGKGDRFFIL